MLYFAIFCCGSKMIYSCMTSYVLLLWHLSYNKIAWLAEFCASANVLNSRGARNAAPTAHCDKNGKKSSWNFPSQVHRLQKFLAGDSGSTEEVEAPPLKPSSPQKSHQLCRPIIKWHVLLNEVYYLAHHMKFICSRFLCDFVQQIKTGR